MRSLVPSTGSLAVAALASTLCLSLAACSSGETASSTSSSGTGGAAPTELQAPPDGQGFQLSFGETVPPGSEVHICKEFVVPGDGSVAISRFESQAPQGMHHVLGYHTPKSPAEVSDDVFDCGDVPGQIFYEQSADGVSANFPEGVGIKLSGGEVVRVELHFLNVGSADAAPKVALNAWYATEPLTAEAGSLFMYDRDIAIPAHGTFTARMHCEIPEDITIVDILPHVHVHGVGERMYVSGGDLTEPQLFVSTTGYTDQETRRFDQGLVIHKGQFIDYECDYDNTTDEDVIEGPSKEHNEMCMVLGDYYPRMEKSGEWCTRVGSGPVLDGSKTCAEAFAALQAGHNLDFASEEVIVNVCAEGNGAWNDIGNCAFNYCSDVCPGPDCNACAQQHCLVEVGACQQAACE